MMKPWAFLTCLESVGFVLANPSIHGNATELHGGCYHPHWYLPDHFPSAALGVVPQSQNSASDSTGKLSSQHVLHCSEPLLHCPSAWRTIRSHVMNITACAVQSHCMQNISSHTVFLMPYGTGLLVVGQKLCALDWLFCSFTAPLHLDSMGVFLQDVHSHPSSVLLCLEYRIPSRLGSSGVETSAMYEAN